MAAPCVLLADFIHTLNIIADFVDVDTKEHTRGTRDVAMAIGKTIGWRGQNVVFLGYGSDIHDIGKIAISPVVFRQPSKLTRAQYESVKKHPEFGAEMISHDSIPKIIKDCVLYHHEHFDGSGYPLGLTGSAIPRCARIVCLSDVWESINSARPYRPAFPRDKALVFMKEHASWFDPDIYAAFLQLVERGVI